MINLLKRELIPQLLSLFSWVVLLDIESNVSLLINWLFNMSFWIIVQHWIQYLIELPDQHVQHVLLNNCSFTLSLLNWIINRISIPLLINWLFNLACSTCPIEQSNDCSITLSIKLNTRPYFKCYRTTCYFNFLPSFLGLFLLSSSPTKNIPFY